MKIACDVIANPNKDVQRNAVISVDNGKITAIEKIQNQDIDIELNDAIVFPGLINIHDHLKYSWHKKIGNEARYTSVYYWLRDLYEEYDTIVKTEEELKILFKLGIYKQIFAATTTVVNHSRYQKQVLSEDEEFIDIYDNFERELVVQPGFLSKLIKDMHKATFGDSIVESHSRAVKFKKPFMIHVAEGRNGETKTEIKDLSQHGILTPESILVHCINTDEEDIELINKGRCSVVWCPYSSKFVTGKVPNIKAFLSKGINICIGTDSSCSGGNNILDEMRFAQIQYKDTFGEDIESSVIFDMSTSHAAKALKQENIIGSISRGCIADIAIVDKKTNNPYDDIVHSNAESIIALLHKGVFVYGDESFFDKFKIRENTQYFRFSINGRQKIVVGNPKKLIAQAKKCFSLEETMSFPFIPQEVK